MKPNRFLSIALLAVLILGLLCGCAEEPGSESQPQSALTVYDHPTGYTISMAEGFTADEPEDPSSSVVAVYKHSEKVISISVAEELYASLEALGMDPDMTLEEYAQLVLDTNSLEAQPETDGSGNVYVCYHRTIQRQDCVYYAYFHQNSVAFWTTTFITTADRAEELEADFALWADTIRLPETAVKEPYQPTIPREELTDREVNELIRTVNWSKAIDWMGRSFETEDLTEEELLQLAHWLNAGRYSGFASISGEQLRQFSTGKYLGREDYPMADIHCSCGEKLGAYDAGTDTMTWCSDHDHRDHYSQADNYFQDVWKEGETYIVTLYKLFPDPQERISGSTIAFYATFADAQAQTNALFTASGEAELEEQVDELDPSGLPLYTLRYRQAEDGDYILTSYTIG